MAGDYRMLYQFADGWTGPLPNIKSARNALHRHGRLIVKFRVKCLHKKRIVVSNIFTTAVAHTNAVYCEDCGYKIRTF